MCLYVFYNTYKHIYKYTYTQKKHTYPPPVQDKTRGADLTPPEAARKEG